MPRTPEESGRSQWLASTEEVARLRETRLALLRLHKGLLEVERLRFERDFGRVEDGLPFLKLVVDDPAFAWLRPLSALIVEFDEELDADEPLTVAGAARLREEARMLTTPEKGGSEYAHNYDRAMQESADVLLLHRAVARAMG